MPATWQSLFGNAAGMARFRRRFNRPTNLDPDERVFVVFSGIGGRADISLNGRFLGTAHQPDAQARDRASSAACPAEFDVTALLEARNELTVEIAFHPEQHPDQPGGLWAPVALEIRRAGL